MNVNFDVIHRPIEFEELKNIMDTKPNNWNFIDRKTN